MKKALKRCTVCLDEKPEDEEHFVKHPETGKYLKRCRKCRNEDRAQRRGGQIARGRVGHTLQLQKKHSFNRATVPQVAVQINSVHLDSSSRCQLSLAYIPLQNRYFVSLP